MKTESFVLCLALAVPSFSPCLLAVDIAPKSWDAFMPAVFKAPEAVALTRNPFQGLGRSLPGTGAPLNPKNTLSVRLAEQVRRGVRGLVVSGEHPCLLFGTRIIAIGQMLEVPVEDPGGQHTLSLRLRAVSREHLAFLADEAGARMIGSEEWSCSLQKEQLP